MVCQLSRFRARFRLRLQGRYVRRQVEIPRWEKLSRTATRNLFTWTLSDGIRPEERAVWQHERLGGLLDIDNEEDDTDMELDSSGGNVKEVDNRYQILFSSSSHKILVVKPLIEKKS